MLFLTPSQQCQSTEGNSYRKSFLILVKYGPTFNNMIVAQDERSIYSNKKLYCHRGTARHKANRLLYQATTDTAVAIGYVEARGGNCLLVI